MFDTTKIREFAESLSDEDLARECSEARELLRGFDRSRIKRCKDDRMQERLQNIGGISAMVLLVAATAGVGLIVGGAFGAGGLLAARATAAMTSGAMKSADELADARIQSLPDADYLAAFLILESRASVFLHEQSKRQRKVEGGSFWDDIKSKAKALLSDAPRSNPAERPGAAATPPSPRPIGRPLPPQNCWKCSAGITGMIRRCATCGSLLCSSCAACLQNRCKVTRA